MSERASGSNTVYTKPHSLIFQDHLYLVEGKGHKAHHVVQFCGMDLSPLPLLSLIIHYKNIINADERIYNIHIYMYVKKKLIQ